MKKKTIEDQGEKEIKEIEDHRREFVKCNELMKKDFNIEKDDIPLEKQKELFNKLFAKNLLNFKNKNKKLILIIWYTDKKTDRIFIYL